MWLGGLFGLLEDMRLMRSVSGRHCELCVESGRAKDERIESSKGCLSVVLKDPFLRVSARRMDNDAWTCALFVS